MDVSRGLIVPSRHEVEGESWSKVYGGHITIRRESLSHLFPAFRLQGGEEMLEEDE